MKRFSLILLMALLAVVLFACGQDDDKDTSGSGTDENKEVPETPAGEDKQAMEDKAKQVDATFKNSDDKTIGSAVISEDEGSEGLVVKLDVENVPAGKHGFHIHEKGTCASPDFKSAGGHFNPTGKKHGMDNPEGPHAGDMENLDVPESGEVKEEMKAEQVSLDEDSEHYLFQDGDVALMIHSGADDYETDPAGDAGERIACAEVKKAE